MVTTFITPSVPGFVLFFSSLFEFLAIEALSWIETPLVLHTVQNYYLGLSKSRCLRIICPKDLNDGDEMAIYSIILT